MLQSGLVSITFRALTVQQICKLAQRCGLRGMEWGGDIHVPPGDDGAARAAAHLTAEHGLAVACYGSYYRAGTNADFSPVLQSALELGAPSIRVWAGEASAACDENRRRQIVDDLNEITLMAAAHNLVVATEYHGGTLTDTAESAARLLAETAASGMRTLWQPRPFIGEETVQQNLAALRMVKPRLLNVHAYRWTQQGTHIERGVMAEGSGEWARYIGELHGHEGWALLEFVREDEPVNLQDDARILNQLLAA